MRQITRWLPFPRQYTRRNDLRNIEERSYLKVLLERIFIKNRVHARECVPWFYSSAGRRQSKTALTTPFAHTCGIVLLHDKSPAAIRSPRCGTSRGNYTLLYIVSCVHFFFLIYIQCQNTGCLLPTLMVDSWFFSNRNIRTYYQFLNN